MLVSVRCRISFTEWCEERFRVSQTAVWSQPLRSQYGVKESNLNHCRSKEQLRESLSRSKAVLDSGVVAVKYASKLLTYNQYTTQINKVINTTYNHCRRFGNRLVSKDLTFTLVPHEGAMEAALAAEEEGYQG